MIIKLALRNFTNEALGYSEPFDNEDEEACIREIKTFLPLSPGDKITVEDAE